MNCGRNDNHRNNEIFHSFSVDSQNEICQNVMSFLLKINLELRGREHKWKPVARKKAGGD